MVITAFLPTLQLYINGPHIHYDTRGGIIPRKIIILFTKKFKNILLIRLQMNRKKLLIKRKKHN